MDQKGRGKPATPAVEALFGLLPITAFAKRYRQRWVRGWLWITAMHIAQLAVGISLRF